MKIASMILISIGLGIIAFCFIDLPFTLTAIRETSTTHSPGFTELYFSRKYGAVAPDILALGFGVGIILLTLGIMFLIYSIKRDKQRNNS
jgi:hypothetical protein